MYFVMGKNGSLIFQSRTELSVRVRLTFLEQIPGEWGEL